MVMRQLRIDRYVVDTLMPDLVGHDRRPSALLVYLFLWAGTSSPRSRRATASLREIGEGTGLSKRSVQDALIVLERRRLLSRTRVGRTGIATYEVLRPWRRR
jgi:hypothetical protein